MKTVSWLSRLKAYVLLTIMACLMFPAPLMALRYLSVKDAVISSLGPGKKIYQKFVTISASDEIWMKKELNWSPPKRKYKVFYVKSNDGSPEKYAVVLEDVLSICGGLHKYSVTIDKYGAVDNVKILELTCDRSYCINVRSFLSQFEEFNIHNHKEKGMNYDAISGATLSTDLTRDIVRRALVLMAILTNKHSPA